MPARPSVHPVSVIDFDETDATVNALERSVFSRLRFAWGAGVTATYEVDPTSSSRLIVTLEVSGGGGSGPTLSDLTPADLGSAAPGTSTEASRADHVHAFPTVEVALAAAAAASSAVSAHQAWLTSGHAGAGPSLAGFDGTDEAALYDVSATPGSGVVAQGDGSGKLDAWITDASGTDKGKVQLATAAPANLAATAAVGTSAKAAREDHVHLLPVLGVTTVITPDPIDGVDTATYPGALEWEREWSGVPLAVLLSPRSWRTVANALSTPPTGFSIVNSSNALSASASGGKLVINGITSGTYDYWTATYTSPLIRSSDYGVQRRRSWVWRMGSQDCDSATEFAQVVIASSAAPTSRWIKVGINGAGGTALNVNTATATTLASATCSRAQLQAGVWIWVECDDESGSWTVYYSTAASRPVRRADWTRLAQSAAQTALARESVTWALGVVRTGSPTGAVDAWCDYYDDRGASGVEAWGPSPWIAAPAVHGAGGYHATRASTVWPVILAAKVGAATIDLTRTRARLLRATNRRNGDAATVTWHIQRGTSSAVLSAPSDGDAGWAAAASVTETGTGDHVTLWVRASSSGLDPASLSVAGDGAALVYNL